MEQDRIETVLSVVDNYTRELERYRKGLEVTTKQISNLGDNTGGASSGVQKLASSFGGLKGILATLGIATAVRELIKLGKSCIDSASEIKELDNVLGQVFGKGQEDIVKWAEQTSSAVGRSTFELQKYTGIFGAIFKGSGIKTEDFQGMSVGLTQLTADLSSFYDIVTDEAFTAIKSGLTGETEPLKRFGIILNETAAAEYALASGITTKWSAMSEAQKQIVRYNFLMEKTSFMQGDAARTIDSYANQMKVMEAHWDSISRTLGGKFIPAGEGALHTINDLLGAFDSWLNKPNLSEYIGGFAQEAGEIKSLGAEYETLSKKSKLTNDEESRRIDIFNQLQSKYPEILSGISSEKGEYKKVGEALDEVINKLQEKIKLQIMEGFADEMAKEVKASLDKVNKAIEKANNQKLKIETDFKIGNVDEFVTPKMIQDLKNATEKGLVERLQAEGKMHQEIKQMLLAQGRTDVQANSIARAMEQYATDQMNALKNSEKEYGNLEKKLTGIAIERDSYLTIFDNFSNQITTGNNTVLQQLMGNKQDIANKGNQIIANTWASGAEQVGKTAGIVKDAKGEIKGSIDGSKDALSMELIQGFLETNDHISIIGSNVTTTIRKGLNGLYSVSQVNSQTGVRSEQDLNLKKLEDTLHGLGPSKAKGLNFDEYKGPKADKGSKGSKKDKKPDKDKYEQMLESLEKQIKEMTPPVEALSNKLKDAKGRLDKLELDKIVDFAKALDWGQADLIQSFIKIKETSRDLARTLGDKSAVEKYTAEIKKLNEQLYFANTSKEYKKKTDEVKYDVKSDDNKEVYNELIKNIEEYVTASKADLDKRYNEGTDDYTTYLDKQLKLFEGIEDTFDKLGLANEKLSASIDKDRVQREKNQNSVVNQIEEIKAIAKYTNEPESETNKKIADVYKNSTEIIAKSIYDLTKQLEKLEKNPINETKSEVGNKEVPVQGIEKINKSANELQEELTFINSEIKNFQSILTEVNNHLSKLPENLKTKQEKDFQRNIDLWKKMLNSAYVKKEQLEYSLGYTNNNIATSSKKDGEETGLLTVEDKKILEGFKTKLGEQLKYITHGINIDFSSVNTVEDVKTWYDGIKKMLSNLTGPASSNKNKAINEGFGLLLSTLEEILKTDTTREVVKSETVNNVNLTEVQKLLELIAVSTKDLEEAKKNEKVAKEETRKTNLTDDFKKGIEDLFLNINTSDIQNSLVSGVKDLFDKAVQGTDISGIYNKKFSDAFGEAFKNSMEGFTPTGNYLKDQEEYQKIFIESLRELSNSSDSAVRSIANLTLFDTVKGQLDELAGHLTMAGEVLKDDFLKNLAVTVESLSALAESLKNTSLTGNSGVGKVLGGIGGFLSNITGTIGMVTGIVSTGVGLFRSAGDLLGFGSSKKQKAKNEEERKKAAEWYDKQFKENDTLLKGINDLTNSIIDLNTKLIQNIASNTTDKNIAKQKNYYDAMIKTTGSLFDENITATGHSTKKKKKLLGSKTTDSYSTLNQSFDEYFGKAWQMTARDSKSLEQFYDSYLKNFNLNDLKKKLGKNTLDSNNIDQVKTQFLRFIDDIKAMETNSKNLPKNGILESFEGVEVVDLFELRNEYQKQLESIYKGMGKDPEKYKEEILNQVNALVQSGETIISAFNDVKSSFYGNVIEGNDTIMSLGTGLESYFTKLRTNISKVFYDINFQGLEENFNDKFASISDKLADFRLSGGKDLSGFVNNNLNFWNEFTQLKSTENIKNDMKEVLDILKAQAKGAGLSDEVINAMFPDSEIDKKATDIKNSLEKAMRDALDTNSFSQFSMSLGDSIYSSVKDGLVEAFYESQTFQSLASKYFLNDDYTKQLEGAGSFKDAYDIIKAQLDKAEIQLQAEGLDFKGTNSSSGEYYGGLSNNYKTPTGLLANDININYTLNNYGFLDADTHLKKIVKIVKEELHESKKKEV